MTEKISPTSLRTRARVLEAVVDTVAEHGLSGTTLARVAAAAEVSQGVLLFHFRSKETLLAETLRRLSEEYRAAWRPALDHADPLDRIAGLVRADFGPDVCTRKRLALWFSFWGESAARPLFSRICEDSERLRYAAMVEACTAYCEGRGAPDPLLLASSIDSMTDGLWLQMHIYGHAISRAQALDSALGHLRLLLPHEAGRI